ncbi:MAG: hypothetical protein IJJ86_00360, partial [Clostridia bacterium]|nr:hypothetical protein [Clostridia bacterium]
ALASELYAIPAFSTPTAEGAETVKRRMLEIGKAISTVPAFGETNAANRALFDAAKAAGVLVSADAFGKGVEP